MEKKENTDSYSINQKTTNNSSNKTSNTTSGKEKEPKKFLTRGTNSLYVEKIDDTQNRHFM